MGLERAANLLVALERQRACPPDVGCALVAAWLEQAAPSGLPLQTAEEAEVHRHCASVPGFTAALEKTLEHLARFLEQPIPELPREGGWPLQDDLLARLRCGAGASAPLRYVYGLIMVGGGWLGGEQRRCVCMSVLSKRGGHCAACAARPTATQRSPPAPLADRALAGLPAQPLRADAAHAVRAGGGPVRQPAWPPGVSARGAGGGAQAAGRAWDGRQAASALVMHTRGAVVPHACCSSAVPLMRAPPCPPLSTTPCSMFEGWQQAFPPLNKVLDFTLLLAPPPKGPAGGKKKKGGPRQVAAVRLRKLRDWHEARAAEVRAAKRNARNSKELLQAALAGAPRLAAVADPEPRQSEPAAAAVEVVAPTAEPAAVEPEPAPASAEPAAAAEPEPAPAEPAAEPAEVVAAEAEPAAAVPAAEEQAVVMEVDAAPAAAAAESEPALASAANAAKMAQAPAAEAAEAAKAPAPAARQQTKHAKRRSSGGRPARAPAPAAVEQVQPAEPPAAAAAPKPASPAVEEAAAPAAPSAAAKPTQPASGGPSAATAAAPAQEQRAAAVAASPVRSAAAPAPAPAVAAVPEARARSPARAELAAPAAAEEQVAARPARTASTPARASGAGPSRRRRSLRRASFADAAAEPAAAPTTSAAVAAVSAAMLPSPAPAATVAGTPARTPAAAGPTPSTAGGTRASAGCGMFQVREGPASARRTRPVPYGAQHSAGPETVVFPDQRQVPFPAAQAVHLPASHPPHAAVHAVGERRCAARAASRRGGARQHRQDGRQPAQQHCAEAGGQQRGQEGRRARQPG